MPGIAERMMTMAETQQARLLEQKNKTANRNHILAVCGQRLVAFICLCFAGIAAAGVL